jgi:UDP-N-acetylmuramate: L-alanyl-gamma-D-glutamyl-meso-diaminopimelate ligase
VIRGITVYDDFAHHPTAISATLSALRAKVGEERIIAVFEPRSNTMKMGVHKDTLAPAFSEADRVVVYRPEGLNWDLEASMQGPGERIRVYDEIAIMVDSLVQQLMPGDHVLIMSNGGFGGFHGKLITRLSEAE